MRPENARISESDILFLTEELKPLVGTQFTSLSLPKAALRSFEPSQIGTIVGALMDALIPYLPDIPQVGLLKHEGILGDREGYPDYRHTSGFRLELKLLYTDNAALETKKPPTPREPSSRLTQKVTLKNVQQDKDALLVIAYQLQPQKNAPDAVSPTIIDFAVLSCIELVEARDNRMIAGGGRWFGNYETPTVLSMAGKRKQAANVPLDVTVYGRKKSEGKDFNEDTNFGKLARIPHVKLQAFLAKHRLVSAGDFSLVQPQTLNEVTTEIEQENNETSGE